MDPVDPYSPFKFSLFAYNNHSGAHIADTQNSIEVLTQLIIIACLQALVNNLLVWQSSCKRKLGPLNNKSICPATY